MDTMTKTAKIRRNSWDADSVTEFVLTPDTIHDDCWTVTLDGTVLGKVRKYEGTIDTNIAGTRLRRVGKRRTLWASIGTRENARWIFGENSRADAIRFLLP